MPKEYWVNVFQYGTEQFFGLCHNSRIDAELGIAVGPYLKRYRIHVKMDGGYNRYGTAAREYKYFEKGDWIGSWGS